MHQIFTGMSNEELAAGLIKSDATIAALRANRNELASPDDKPAVDIGADITSTSPKSVVIYSKAKGCVQCDAMDRAVNKTDIVVTKLDGTTDENRAFCLSLGHMQAPVVVVYQDGAIIDHFSGFNPGKINELKNDPLVERKAPAEARELIAA